MAPPRPSKPRQAKPAAAPVTPVEAVAATVPVLAEPAPAQPVAAAITAAAASAVEDAITVTEPAPAPSAAASFEEKTMNANTTAEQAVAKGQAVFTDMNERARAAMAKSSTLFAELNEFGKGNVEAIVESGKIAVTGFQSLGQDAAEYGRKSFENATSAFKGMAQVKSPTELAKLHSDFVRSAFDAMVAETSRSTEAMLKLAGEVAQPISNRIAVAAEKVKLAA